MSLCVSSQADFELLFWVNTATSFLAAWSAVLLWVLVRFVIARSRAHRAGFAGVPDSSLSGH